MGFQKPPVTDHHPKAECNKDVAMPRVHDESGVITITCGWAKAHTRRKVREDAAERHLKRKHNGRGLWL